MEMGRKTERFTPVQETIMVAAGRNPGRYSRSGLAKLLVGSKSSETAGRANDPDYGRLSNHGRKAITFEIDILVQQSYLALDHQQHVVPGTNFAGDYA
jgi:hypothetical protein